MPPVVIVMVMAVVFTAILAGGQSLYWAYVVRKETEKAELARRLGHGTEDEFTALIRDRAKDAAGVALGNLGSHIQDVLAQADSMLTVGALLIRMGAGAAIGMVVGLVALGAPGLILVPLGFLAPYIYFRRAGTARAKLLTTQLPEVLDLMARSLQAGLGLNDALKMVAEEMPMPAAAEFGRVFEEVRFGREYREALNNLVSRNPSIFDLRLFVSSVLLQRETGGNLIEILENISGTIRTRFLFDAKVQAMTAEAKFSGYILAALPAFVGTMVFLLNPAYMNPLFENAVGNFMLFYAFSSYAFGIYLMQVLSSVEV